MGGVFVFTGRTRDDNGKTTMSAPPKLPNASLQKKRAARQLAVQCLYQRIYTEPQQTAERLIQHAMTMQESEEDEEMELAVTPDARLLRGIVAGSGDMAAVLEEKIGGALGGRWQGERLTPLMKAILRAATYELIYHPELRPAIILDEYVSVAADFYGEQETRLLNGLLQELVKKIR